MNINKGQGATIGAILLAGLLLRPLGSYSPQQTASSNGVTPLTGSSTQEPEKQGPWIASCNYWAADRNVPETDSSSSRDAHPMTAAPGTNLKVQIQPGIPVDSDQRVPVDVYQHPPPEGQEQACGSDPTKRWGIPVNGVQLRVTALIATVPDPVHTHLALSFDRTVDALLQAAADNGYNSSYYWLPWMNRVGALKAAESSGDDEPGHDPERERMPGLIVLKHVTDPDNPDIPPSGSHFQAIYLFLVAESPTWGVDAFQLRNALLYENQVQAAVRMNSLTKRTSGPEGAPLVSQFFRGQKDHTAIIGPLYTGSAGPMRAAIETAAWNWSPEDAPAKPGGTLPGEQAPTFDLAGETSTPLAMDTLALKGGTAQINYLSFMANAGFDHDSFLRSLKCSGYDLTRVAELVEDDTAAGSAKANSGIWKVERKPVTPIPEQPCDRAPGTQDAFLTGSRQPILIRFPREISLLRNARSSSDQGGEPAPGGSPPSPYLHLSLKDSSAADSVPQFSRENTPLSQEAQLMEIARLLQRNRIEFVSITATNTLDEIFLLQFLHRARPDVRLVSFGGDLLRDREIDNVPFVGMISVNPYSLLSLNGPPTQGAAIRALTDTSSAAAYNAASYTFWTLNTEIREFASPQPHLSSYSSLFEPLPDPTLGTPMYPPLWVTAIGTDGNYPLALLSPCASDSPQQLPVFTPGIDPKAFDFATESAERATESAKRATESAKTGVRHKPVPKDSACGVFYSHEGGDYHKQSIRDALWRAPTIYPSLSWEVFCALIFSLCLVHTVVLWVADSRYLFTRDLAVDENDEPRRRSMAIHIGAVTLFSMAFVIAWPLLSLRFVAHVFPFGIAAAIATLVGGLAAIIATFWRTWHWIWWAKTASVPVPTLRGLVVKARENGYPCINIITWAALALLPINWCYECSRALIGTSESPYSLVGVSFAFRCIHPTSGLSPAVPVLVLLFSWYLWAFFLIRRLRFSSTARPRLPKKIGDQRLDGLFVSDEDLDGCESPQSPSLYRNITCLLITRTALRRFVKLPRPLLDGTLVVTYTALLILLSVFTPIRSLNHFLWSHRHHFASFYEMLIGGVFFPLTAIALAGWLRIVMIWSSLKAGLLDRLENLPIRFAFSRLQGMRWMTMLRQDGIHRPLRDQARSAESARQMLNQTELKERLGEAGMKELKDLRARFQGELTDAASGPNCGSVPHASDMPPYLLANRAELYFAAFSRVLLERVLIPYWQHERIGLVESNEQQEVPIKARSSEAKAEAPGHPLQLHTGAASADPPSIQLAEEFLAIRYLSLIRAVLAHLGSLMSFVSAAFVLAVIAWNCYPFQPRQEVNWALTGLLLFLGSGIVWVFAQMHRDPILSRITATTANELGLDFYIRIITFGAVPVVTWLAYQFPEIGGAIFNFLQPGLEVVK
jgi:hypothetical protein